MGPVSFEYVFLPQSFLHIHIFFSLETAILFSEHDTVNTLASLKLGAATCWVVFKKCLVSLPSKTEEE